jgi:hypothetical protein
MQYDNQNKEPTISRVCIFLIFHICVAIEYTSGHPRIHPIRNSQSFLLTYFYVLYKTNR